MKAPGNVLKSPKPDGRNFSHCVWRDSDRMKTLGFRICLKSSPLSSRLLTTKETCTSTPRSRKSPSFRLMICTEMYSLYGSPLGKTFTWAEFGHNELKPA